MYNYREVLVGEFELVSHRKYKQEPLRGGSTCSSSTHGHYQRSPWPPFTDGAEAVLPYQTPLRNDMLKTVSVMIFVHTTSRYRESSIRRHDISLRLVDTIYDINSRQHIEKYLPRKKKQCREMQRVQH